MCCCSWCRCFSIIDQKKKRWREALFFLQRFVIDFSYNMTCILAGSLALYLSLTPKSVCLFTVADSSRPVPDERINRMHFLFFSSSHFVVITQGKEAAFCWIYITYTTRWIAELVRVDRRIYSRRRRPSPRRLLFFLFASGGWVERVHHH